MLFTRRANQNAAARLLGLVSIRENEWFHRSGKIHFAPASSANARLRNMNVPIAFWSLVTILSFM